MKRFALVLILLLALLFKGFSQNNKHITLSMRLLSGLKENKTVDNLVDSIANIKAKELQQELDNDEKRKAFWINVYNGFVQYILGKNPEKFNNRGAFFKSKQITVAGKLLSLDNIEHGIIRRSKNKLSLGYLNKIRKSKFEKKFRITKVDWRVHFALNCGAKSCPRIPVLDGTRCHEQLQKAAEIYLKETSIYKDKKVEITSLCSWFRADFGGKKGVIKILKNFGIVPRDVKPKISYAYYDWTLALGNYIDI